MTGGFATLPMYDPPEVAPATDRLWAGIRDALRAEGIAAPEALLREADYMAAWTRPGLVLSQTCGLPYVRLLRDRVTLLAAPDFGVEDCPPGWYRSVIVVRAEDGRPDLAAFRSAGFALNGWLSQSGYAAIAHEVAKIAAGPFFATAIVTGSHAASARAVARGAADIAALDIVSWRLIRAFVPEAAGLRVLHLSDPTPGLPYIAAPGRDPAPFRRALAAGIGALGPGDRATLGLRGIVPVAPADYDLLGDRLAAAEARVTLGPEGPPRTPG